MDPSVLKTILNSQQEAFKGSLDIFMKQINEKLKAHEDTIDDLTRSLEHTQKEFEEVKKQVVCLERVKKEHEGTITNLTKEMQEKEQTIRDLDARANYQEDYNRRNNLQIVGLEEAPGENWEQTSNKVSTFLGEKLQLPNLEIERAHRVGVRQEHRHRPIIARFVKFADREAVKRNAAKLRGTRVYINEDLCPASQEKRKEQLPRLKQAREEGKIAYFNYTRLVIKERREATNTAQRTEADTEALMQTGRGSLAEGSSSTPVSTPAAHKPRGVAGPARVRPEAGGSDKRDEGVSRDIAGAGASAGSVGRLRSQSGWKKSTKSSVK